MSVGCFSLLIRKHRLDMHPTHLCFFALNCWARKGIEVTTPCLTPPNPISLLRSRKLSRWERSRYSRWSTVNRLRLSHRSRPRSNLYAIESHPTRLSYL